MGINQWKRYEEEKKKKLEEEKPKEADEKKIFHKELTLKTLTHYIFYNFFFKSKIFVKKY